MAKITQHNGALIDSRKARRIVRKAICAIHPRTGGINDPMWPERPMWRAKINRAARKDAGGCSLI